MSNSVLPETRPIHDEGELAPLLSGVDLARYRNTDLNKAGEVTPEASIPVDFREEY